MKTRVALPLAAALTLTAVGAAEAASLYSQFLFNGGLTDQLGNSTATGAGTAAGGDYSFAANQGLRITTGTTLSSFSLVFDVALADPSGYRKLADFSGLGSDCGLYNHSGSTSFYCATSNSASVFAANTPTTVVLTYDSLTDQVVTYVGGVLQLSFTDVSNLVGPLTAVTLVEDDNVTSKAEASAGVLGYVELYDGVLSVSEVAALTSPTTPVPLPATLPLMALGLIGSAAVLRRR